MESVSLSSDKSSDDLYPKWYNQRIRNNYQHLMDLLEKKKFIYNSAGDYYRKMNYYFVIPSIFITTLSSIFAFLSTSDIIADKQQDIFIILVGIFTAFSTMMQSISSSVGYATKKEMFLGAADQYDKNIIKITFEINNPSDENLIKVIEEDIKKIEENCKCLPPNWIITKWDNKIKKLNALKEPNYLNWKEVDKNNNNNKIKNINIDAFKNLTNEKEKLLCN
jgi:hypothetical protein